MKIYGIPFFIYFKSSVSATAMTKIILFLDGHFLLIINAVPLGTSTLPQEAQTQGIQIAAQQSECPIDISMEIRLLFGKQSPKLLQVSL